MWSGVKDRRALGGLSGCYKGSGERKKGSREICQILTGNASKDGRRMMEGGHTESLPPVLFKLEEYGASSLDIRRFCIADDGWVMHNVRVMCI